MATILKELILSSETFFHNGIKLHQFFIIHDLSHYVHILSGPIYPVAITELWKNAIVDQDEDGNDIIVSTVFGHIVIINVKLRSKVMKCKNKGHIPAEIPNRFISEDLHAVLRVRAASFQVFRAKIWHQLLVNNFYPRQENTQTVMMEDINCLYSLLRSRKTNLPFVIFRHLKASVVDFHAGKTSYIPCGRLLSRILFETNIM